MKGNAQLSLWLALALALSAGCFTLKEAFRVLTADEIEEMGTRSFAEPPEEVFPATVDTLKIMEFSVVVQQPELGRIHTGRKVMDRHINNGAVTTVTHQYEVHLREHDNGGTTVILLLHVFVNDEEMPLRSGDRGQFAKNNAQILAAVAKALQ